MKDVHQCSLANAFKDGTCQLSLLGTHRLQSAWLLRPSRPRGTDLWVTETCATTLCRALFSRGLSCRSQSTCPKCVEHRQAAGNVIRAFQHLPCRGQNQTRPFLCHTVLLLYQREPGGHSGSSGKKHSSCWGLLWGHSIAMKKTLLPK